MDLSGRITLGTSAPGSGVALHDPLGRPAVLLLHMCNTDRKSWAPAAQQLSAVGIHAVTVDYRGFGESAGPKQGALPLQEAQKVVAEKWPGDIDAAFDFLLSQPEVDKAHVGLGGGSCGVTQAIHVAMRHPNVISLVLLAGRVDAPALDFLLQKHFPPIFAAAAADDQYSAHAPEEMQWLSNISGNPRNKFVAFKDGRHGTEIFVPHPELPRQIVAWFVETLIKSPADPKAPVTTQKTPASEFLALADSATTVSKAVLYFHNARAHNPQAFLIPEFVMNGIGYGYIQAGQNDAAITILKLNTEAFPTSANTFDSLADAYLAAGQKEEALAAEQKCLELLPIDKIGDDFKAALRQAAEEKLKKLKANASN